MRELSLLPIPPTVDGWRLIAIRDSDFARKLRAIGAINCLNSNDTLHHVISPMHSLHLYCCMTRNARFITFAHLTRQWQTPLLLTVSIFAHKMHAICTIDRHNNNDTRAFVVRLMQSSLPWCCKIRNARFITFAHDAHLARKHHRTSQVSNVRIFPSIFPTLDDPFPISI